MICFQKLKPKTPLSQRLYQCFKTMFKLKKKSGKIIAKIHFEFYDMCVELSEEVIHASVSMY